MSTETQHLPTLQSIDEYIDALASEGFAGSFTGNAGYWVLTSIGVVPHEH